MSDGAFEISERLKEAVEAELVKSDEQAVFVALIAVAAALVATMPREEADDAVITVRTGFAEFVDGARSQL